MKTKVTQSLVRQKANHDKSTKLRVFKVGDTVFVRNPQGTPAWWEGVIERITDPLSYRIKLNNGTVIKRHVDHIRIQHSPQQHDVPTEQDFDTFTFPSQDEDPSTSSNNTNSNESQTVPELRRSTRRRQPPVRFS